METLSRQLESKAPQLIAYVESEDMDAPKSGEPAAVHERWYNKRTEYESIRSKLNEMFKTAKTNADKLRSLLSMVDKRVMEITNHWQTDKTAEVLDKHSIIQMAQNVVLRVNELSKEYSDVWKMKSLKPPYGYGYWSLRKVKNAAKAVSGGWWDDDKKEKKTKNNSKSWYNFWGDNKNVELNASEYPNDLY